MDLHIDNKSVKSKKEIMESNQIALNDQTEKIKKLANVQSELIGKENSLKRLKEENVTTGRSKKELEPIKPA